MYLLIFDLDDGGPSKRQSLDRHLSQKAQRVQSSIWRFRNFRELERAAGLVAEAGGQAMAFMESDRILLNRSDARKVLSKFS